MKVICYGDSNTYGYDPRGWLGGRYGADDRWVDILAKRTGWEILNWGLNGREILPQSTTFPADTDLLMVMLGTNDLLQGRTPSETAQRMLCFLAGLTVEHDKILLIALPPVAFGAWVQEQRLIDASAELAVQYQALAERLGVRFADAGAWGVGLAYDGVHFTEQGHRAFAEGIWKELIVSPSISENTSPNTPCGWPSPRSPTPAGSARGDRTAGQRQGTFNFSSSGAAGPARGTPGGKHSCG